MTHLEEFNKSYKDLYSKLMIVILEESSVIFPQSIEEHSNRILIGSCPPEYLKETLRDCLDSMISEIQEKIRNSFVNVRESQIEKLNKEISKENYV